MDNNATSEVYYFWTDEESNTHGVTVADSESEDFSVIEEFTLDELGVRVINLQNTAVNKNA